MFSKNKFYSDWDCITLGERHLPDDEYRTPFEIDRDRIIHSTAFRRLQSKTQVYVTGQSDQYRTRLTHSIEVAQIGRSMVNFLNRKSPSLSSEFHINNALVEAACLAHDLGNPPIGHQGESRLNELMDPWGGFEGNAQSLRILTDIVRGDRRGIGKGGMQPTRALLDAILKYKVVGKENSPAGAKFLYPDQEAVKTWVHEDAGLDIRSQGGESVRSIECEIMDLSDDIAYTTSDLFDGVKQSVLSADQVQNFWNTELSDVSDILRSELDEVLRGKFPMSRFVASLIGRWITSVSLKVLSDPLKPVPRYQFGLEIGETAAQELQALRKLNYALIYSSDYVKRPETAGVMILEELFIYYRDAVLGQRPVHEKLPLPRGIAETSDESIKMRHVCDWIAGMTDNFALRLQSQLRS
ncbi:MAG: dNTP triphosphohydrolase [Candidatus Marinimicrobia bacterium]|nr:dNTP triphosphohydrolase [Candidatus Neomarinimicrobiota bacterium]MCF7851251.1 dNTP triphosphohydrolase [Candidatus Neomarinimicrobiota bacterium]